MDQGQIPGADGGVLEWALGLLGTLMLFITKAIHGRVAAVDKKQSAHEKEVAEKYLPRSEFATGVDRFDASLENFERNMSASFRRLNDKLDGKVDK